MPDRHDDLAAALADLEAFSYALSHDIRSPLGAIVNFSAILRDDYGDALGSEGASMLQRIERNARQAVGMLDDVLRFASIGRRELEIRPVDFNVLVGECVREVRGAGEGERTQVSVGSLPRVSADAELMKVVFVELLDNAVRFTSEVAAPEIAVTGELGELEARFTVRDNGVGFGLADGARLFRLFERVRERVDLEGRGIGLALVARALGRQGGRAVLESKPGEGTAVRIHLPLDSEEAQRERR